MSAPDALPAPTLPAARPTYILRGHASPVQTLAFFRQNSCFASGDADGFVVIWSVAIRRPVAVWRAHEASILGLQTWGDEKLITQGRDSKLVVWDLSNLLKAPSAFSVTLPAESLAEHRKQPWLLHTIDVTTLNFCSFASCSLGAKSQNEDDQEGDDQNALLIAVSGASDSEIELYQLPAQEKKGLITAPQDNAGKAAGMVMALQMLHDNAHVLTVISAYENGQTCVFKRVAEAMSWQQVYSSKPHTQPVLSLDVTPAADFYFTSGADGMVAKHPLTTGDDVGKVVQTRHSGQQGLHVRSDGRIFATAGWDHNGRVYSARTLKELAVLQWHKESCYSIAFAAISERTSQAALTDVAHTCPTIAQAREAKVRATHWLAMGSKDGKISLWDIY